MTGAAIPPDLDLADFTPKRRIVTNVTRAQNAVVTTSEPHGYVSGQVVRMYVDGPNPMRLDGIITTVLIDGNDPNNDVNFVTDIDTQTQFAFSNPTFPPAFTEAHVVPLTGDTQNIAGPLVGNSPI